ncbi:MAG: hypothetical protein HYU29_02445 [Chloroflexi bacterium]|nr:hypothetical protein [Chloroflexota bacterium]
MSRRQKKEIAPAKVEGVPLPRGSLEEMARRLVEALRGQGLSEGQILDTFRNPLSGGPYALYLSKGEKWVHRLIGRVLSKASLQAAEVEARGSPP